MRQDMKDVIIDTGRYGKGYDQSKKTQPSNDVEKLDNLPEQEGMKRRWAEGGWGWSFGDRLTPIWKFLEKNVGRHWDDVWSEICDQADSRNIRGYHLREHVQSYVTGSGGQEGLGRWYRSGPFYVDDNGILRQNERRRYRYRKPEPDPDACYIRDRRFERINGCWFEVWYEKVEKSRQRWNFYLQRKEVEYYTDEIKVRQRQLSKRDLRDLGFSNDPDWKWWKHVG